MRLEKSKPDVQWVSWLAGSSSEDASKYISEAASDTELSTHLSDTLLGGGRSNYVQIAAPFELYALTRLRKPSHIVEVGVSAGVSSAYFLSAIKRNRAGKLHSIDLPEEQSGEKLVTKKEAEWALPPGKTPGWAVPKELRKGWDLRLGFSNDVISKLIDEIDSVGIFLYDVPWTMKTALADFKEVDKNLRVGSVVLADNALAAIQWWAKTRGAHFRERRGLGLRGFAIK